MTAMKHKDSKAYSRASSMIVLFVLGPILIVYMPLMLAGAEQLIFGTHEVEDFCRLLGVHGLLKTIYQNTVFYFLK
jgi:hypothetical protein